ncbi:MAG: 3-isopropylmalate dehydratase small subunit [Halobacteriota archaeon]|nr:3-isopropylmalate dehydratase small subunit [Halobacteriota archaeon]
MKQKVEGKVFKFGDNVDTDQIIPAEFLTTGDPKELAKNAFVKVRSEFSREVKDGDIIVAGYNFGCGSSREHAPRALMGSGVSCVIARSFARIYFRNSINIGLPAIECNVEADDGDRLEVDFEEGKIRNLTKGEEYVFQPLPDFLQKIFDLRGLVNYVKEEIGG